MKSEKGNKLWVQACDAWDAGKLALAFHLFYAAALKGNGSAINNLGYFYDQGIGVEVNKIAALKWYRKGAKQKDICAQLNLGILYHQLGRIKRAKRALLTSLKTGDDAAALYLAKIYMVETSKKSQQRAEYFLQKTIDSGNVFNFERKRARVLLTRLQRR